MLQVEGFFRQCRMLLRHCCRFWQQCCRFRRQCRTKFRPFDKVETNWTCSVCFDFVERTKFNDKRSTLLPFVATKSNVASTKSNVASTLLLVWTGLKSTFFERATNRSYNCRSAGWCGGSTATVTDRFLELSAKCFDPLLERVDLVSELGHRTSIVVALCAQLLQHSWQLAVLGLQITASSLLRLQLRLHVTQLLNVRHIYNQLLSVTLLLVRVRSKYCDQRVCVFVCLSLCLSARRAYLEDHAFKF